jgi:disulfide bond formation protein DsbB
MSHRLGYWVAHVNVLAVCGVLLGAFGVQFGWGELPCPLCVLQRMAMLLCALGPAFIIVKARRGDVDVGDFATGYGMSVLAGLAGAAVAGRQVLLHVLPSDPGYGKPVLGLHLYTWSFIVFAAVLLDSGANLLFARGLTPRGVKPGWPSALVLWLLGALILANAAAVFVEEGLHWTLPDDPGHYRLLDDIGWQWQAP